MAVRVRCGPHDELGALAGGGKPGSVAVLHQLPLVLLEGVLDLPHRAENSRLGLVGGQGLQSLLRGQFYVDAESVRQQAQLLHQLRGGAGDGLGVDITVEAVLVAQNGEAADHPLGGVVRIFQHPGGEEQPLDVVAAVELDGQLCQLLRRKGGTLHIVAAPVDAVFAVVDAAVGHQHLQQRDAPPVGGESVAAPGQRTGGVADVPLPAAPAGPAGGTGCVILGRVGEDGELFHDVHRPALPSQ